MARKLKAYQTSLGFYDLAIAAPSMKAALEAWGSKSDLFHQGVATEAHDPAIVAATMAKPGVVLRRPVGSNGSFSERAELPKDLIGGKAIGRPGKRIPKPEAPPPRKVDDKAAREAAIALARDQKRRDRERHKQEAAQESGRKRRGQAIAKAETALEDARRVHDIKTEEIAAERSAIERRSDAEESRWDKQRAKLEAALSRARG